MALHPKDLEGRQYPETLCPAGVGAFLARLSLPKAPDRTEKWMNLQYICGVEAPGSGHIFSVDTPSRLKLSFSSP